VLTTVNTEAPLEQEIPAFAGTQVTQMTEKGQSKSRRELWLLWDKKNQTWGHVFVRFSVPMTQYLRKKT
jgi:hypothetical protein